MQDSFEKCSKINKVVKIYQHKTIFSMLYVISVPSQTFKIWSLSKPTGCFKKTCWQVQRI